MKIDKEAARFLRSPAKAIARFNTLVDPKKLTTPVEIDSNIRSFSKHINPDREPFFIDVTPEPWCRQSCCNLNVRKHIDVKGGEMLCGYKIWYNVPVYVEAERHAIWVKGDDKRDLTFNADGEMRIAFVPDVPERSKRLEDNVKRKRWSIRPDVRALIRAYETLEGQVPIHTVSHEEAWEVMPSYEDWLNGKRMSSVFMKVR